MKGKNIVLLYKIMHRLRTFDTLAESAVSFSQAKGWVRLLTLPNLAATIVQVATNTKRYYIDSHLTKMNYTKIDWPEFAMHWLKKILDETQQDKIPMKLDNNNLIVYPTLDFIYHEGDPLPGLWILKGREENFKNFIADYTKKNFSALGGTVVRLVPKKIRGIRYDEPADLTAWDFVPVTDRKVSIIEGAWAPSIADVAKSIEGGRVALSYGPSGTGKTEMGIQACLRQGKNNIFVVPGSVFSEKVGGHNLKCLLDAFGFSAVIVDDIPPSSTVQVLNELDLLKNAGIPVLFTLMVNKGRPSLPGFRPGRFDRIFRYSVPKKEDQIAILTMYNDQVDWSLHEEKFKDFVPAYLKELADRVRQGDDINDVFASLREQLEIANGTGDHD